MNVIELLKCVFMTVAMVQQWLRMIHGETLVNTRLIISVAFENSADESPKCFKILAPER